MRGTQKAVFLTLASTLLAGCSISQNPSSDEPRGLAEQFNSNERSAESKMKTEEVGFSVAGSDVVGTLYLPASPEKTPYHAVIVTGAWTTIKEQMPATYARKLAEHGYAALIFDFRTWGESDGPTRSLEDPSMKIEDILEAAEYLAARDDVQSVSALGICASAGYVATAASRSSAISSVALVAPWLHDEAIVNEVYGGEDGVQSLLTVAEDAEERENESGKPQLIPAAGPAGSDALMAMDSYYTDPEGGMIPEWENTFNLRSWKGWLTFDAIQSAPRIVQPMLIVHSDAAAIPHGAKRFYKDLRSPKSQLWLDNVSQFDFYDQEQAVNTSVAAAVEHFKVNANESDTTDELKILGIVEAVGVLADRGAFDQLERLYSDEVLLDYTSMAGGEAELLGPTAIMTRWAGVLPGFDVTRHRIGEELVLVQGDRAIATAAVTADHVLDGETWTVNGRYRYLLERDEDSDWHIKEHTFLLESETGDRALISQAIQRASESPNAYLRRTSAQDAVRQFLESLESKDMEAFADVWAEDAVQEMPYAPEGFPEKVVGKSALIAHYAGWPEISGKADFTSHLVFHPTTDPDIVFVEFRGKVEIKKPAGIYNQTYGGLFHVEDGKIVYFREYFDPVVFSKAFGIGEHAAPDSE